MVLVIHPNDMLQQGLLAVKIDRETQAGYCKAALVDKFKSYFGKQIGKEGCQFCSAKCYNSKTSVHEILETTE